MNKSGKIHNKLFETFLSLIIIFSSSSIFAAKRNVDFVVAYKTVHFSGSNQKAIAVNGQIPGPLLHFKEGDEVTIRVFNQLSEATTIHWHGLLVPWQKDGVENISQKGIPSQGVYEYRFTLKQAGTYWYHAHAGLQEQQGLYGALIIDPLRPTSYHYTRDYTIVLSDWINTHPEQVLANLKKDGDYYSPRFPLQPSLMKFIHDYRKSSKAERQTLLSDYQMMQQMRMGLYDLSDVAYDAYLLNGYTNYAPWSAPVKVGDRVRLRFIGAGGSTLFHVKMPGLRMQVVQVDGNDVHPYTVDDFTIAPGETFDVLVTIQKKEPALIYAESNDQVGAALGALLISPQQKPDFRTIQPFPEPPPVTRQMHGMDHETMNMSHEMPHLMNSTHAMAMSLEPTIHEDSFSKSSPTQTNDVGKYQKLTATVKTNDPRKPVAQTIRMELFGYMGQYIWMINGVPEYDAKPIVLDPGKRYRFVFINTSMMHHPMHLHGHWFILRKGQGAYDPLLHTIDVAPGATITADVDTDASGQWIFHCHLLYHMVTGMARVVQYSTLLEITRHEAKPQDIVKNTRYENRPIVRVDEEPINPSLVSHPMAHHSHFWFANFIDLGWDPVHQVERLTYKGLFGPDYNKLQLFINDGEVNQGSIENADLDIFYWRLIYQNWALKGGTNYTYRPANTPYWQPGIGIEGLMPYYLATNLRAYYHSGSAKLDAELARDTQITDNFFLRLGLRAIAATKTVRPASIGAGINQWRFIARPYYRLMPAVSVFAEYEHEKDYGPFKVMQNQDGETGVQNTVTLGLSLVF